MMCRQCNDESLLKGALLRDVFSSGKIWLYDAVCSVLCFGIQDRGERTVNYCKFVNTVKCL